MKSGRKNLLLYKERGGSQPVIRGAIFDLDGTLLDSMPMWNRAGEVYLAGLGVRAKPGLAKVMFPMTIQQSAVYLRQEYALPLTEGEIIAGINRTIEGFYRSKALFKKGVPEFLKGLKAAGIVMAVATVTDRPYVEAALHHLKARQYFRAVLTATEVGAGKDRPDIYLKTAAALGTAAEETLVFEDALHAARTAKAAGFQTVGVYDASSEDCQAALREECNYYLTDFKDFSSFAAEALK